MTDHDTHVVAQGDDSGLGTGMMVGIIVVILLIIAMVLIFGRGLFTGAGQPSGGGGQAPSQVDVNVQNPVGGQGP